MEGFLHAEHLHAGFDHAILLHGGESPRLSPLARLFSMEEFIICPKQGLCVLLLPCKRAHAREQGGGSPAVEPLIRSTTDLTIIDRPATPYHRPDPPSLRSEEANPNPNGSGSGSSPRISPLGNRIIRRVLRLPTSSHTQPAAGHPGAITDARPSDSTVRRVWFCH
jgi:hypothetical protein